ncbi:MAG: flavodoxin [Lachnospiraceae bacterium]|nr:flavodoxin [Lachnospiraceae bacterium]
MGKVAVVYWSGTGNTEKMAAQIAESARKSGKEADVYTSADFKADMADEYDAIAFGCPSMGDEVLEETEFEPMFNECKNKLSGKKIALFGSYGWGSGEWMDAWTEECKELGAILVHDSVIVNYEPADSEEGCVSLGAALAG